MESKEQWPKVGWASVRRNGFTLVEMIVVIVITGIIAGMVAIFIQSPVQGYVDSARRAELTDIADTAVRRMARDVRVAVPNSMRQSNCSAPCIEFILTRTGGRYRDGTPGDMLKFGVADNSFDVLGAITINAGDFIVVGSTQSDGSLPYDMTAAGVLRAYPSATGTFNNLAITNAVGLPKTSHLASQRFDVVDGTQKAVTYACEGVGTDAQGNGTGVLRRYWNYGFNVLPSVTSAIIASHVSSCAITYDLPNQRFGLLVARFTLTSAHESIVLYNEIHVDNAP